jgi:Domain of unknown function (DUF4398)
MKSLMTTRVRFAPLAAALAVGLAALAGCASTPAPVEQMAVAEAAVARANTTGTSENSAVELKVATNKLAGAREAMASKDYELARRLAEQAEVDAQVAELRSQAARARVAAQESKDASRVLSEEVNRKSVR